MSIRIKHHPSGYRQLLTAPRVQADLERRAQAIADAAGDGFDARSSAPILRRNRAAVVAPYGDPNNRMIRSLDSGR